MFSSRARRTAAMMEAQMATVDAKRARSLDSSSLAIALRSSPMFHSISDEKAKLSTAVQTPAISRLHGSLPSVTFTSTLVEVNVTR